MLLVGAEANERALLASLLDPLGCEVLSAGDALEAAALMPSSDLVLLNAETPDLGRALLQKLKSPSNPLAVPVLVLISPSDMASRPAWIAAGADDFLTRPVDPIDLQIRVNSLLKIRKYNQYVLSRSGGNAIEQKIRQLEQQFRSAEANSLETIYRLLRAAEFRDEDTGQHIQRMSGYSAAVARQIGLDSAQVEQILHASPMHDVGKIGIPDQILLKPGPLNSQEWEIMKQHTVIGGRILADSKSELIEEARVIALTHHEKWNGSGYPQGLSGQDIPISGRVVAVADVFEALTSQRPYKPALDVEQALTIIRQGRGRHFDPQVVDGFLAAQAEILAIKSMFKARGTRLSASA